MTMPNRIRHIPRLTSASYPEVPLSTFVQRCGVPHVLPTDGAVIDLQLLETGYQWSWINLKHKICFENFARVMVFADPGSYYNKGPSVY